MSQSSSQRAMYWIIIFCIFLCESYAQLTSPDEAVCVGEQVVFNCQQPGSALTWTVNLPGGISNRLTNGAASSQVGTVLTFVNDPFVFKIYILPSSSASSIISELRVTAVRQLNGVTVECVGPNGSSMSTIQIALITAPSGVMTTANLSQFTPSMASVTLTWSASSGADNYTIMVTPLLQSGQSLVSTTTTSLQLTVLYNEEYSINITAQNCAESNSTLVSLTVAGCSPPSPPANGSISEYSSGAVDAMLTFQCDPGYMPQEEMTSTCLSNSSWVPIPECEGTIGDTTVNDGPDFPITDTQSKGSGNSDTLSTGSQVIITAIVCSLVCFILGSLFGAVIVSLTCLRYVKKIKNNFKLTNSSSPTPPAASATVIYEEVSPADSHTERKNDIELTENVAYGPVTKSN